jgi:plastocyanin
MNIQLIFYCRVLSIAVAFAAVACSPPQEDAAPTTAAEPAAPMPAAGNLVTGVVPPAKDGSPAIVVLEPRAAQELPAQEGAPVMDQVGLAFTPGVLLVRTGQPSEFRNSDDVLHNVRVREEATKEGTFNVAIPTGQAYTHTFQRDGFYDVGCDIHPGMSAIVVATSTPFTVMADANGQFTINDVPPGAYKVTVYTGSDKLQKDVDVTAGRTEVQVS